jgi:hypothetical protein
VTGFAEPSIYFYWDNNAGRASITRKMDQARALEAAHQFAREERDKRKCPFVARVRHATSRFHFAQRTNERSLRL